MPTYVPSLSIAASVLTFDVNIIGPYSKFRVGACLLTEEGEFIVGANVENVSYPVGVCAERCAFSTAVVCSEIYLSSFLSLLSLLSLFLLFTLCSPLYVILTLTTTHSMHV